MKKTIAFINNRLYGLLKQREFGKPLDETSLRQIDFQIAKTCVYDLHETIWVKLGSTAFSWIAENQYHPAK